MSAGIRCISESFFSLPHFDIFSYFFQWESFWTRFLPDLIVFDNNSGQVWHWLRIVEIFDPTEILLSYFRSIFILYIPEKSRKVSECKHALKYIETLKIPFHERSLQMTSWVWSHDVYCNTLRCATSYLEFETPRKLWSWSSEVIIW